MKTLIQQGVNIAIAQMPVVAGNPRLNAQWMIGEIAAAAGRGVDIIVFPELCVPGYLIGDMPEDDSFVSDVWYWSQQVVDATELNDVVAIFGSYAIDYRGAVGEDGRVRKINAGFVAQHGELLKNRAGRQFFAKTLMPKYRMFDDERHYLSAQKLAYEEQQSMEAYLQPYDVTIAGHVLRIGTIICEDMWHADYAINPGQIQAKHGIDLMANISCSPWGWQKNRARHQNVRRLSRDIKVPFVYVNNVMPQNNGKNFVVFDGSSTVYTEHGDVAAYLPPYFTGVQDVVVTTGMSPVAYKEEGDVTQLWLALESGLRAYFASLPEHLRHAVIGLSGGIDSAVVAAMLVYILGPDRVTGINMPNRDYNSSTTRDAAKELADNLGITYHVLPIDNLVSTQAALHDIELGSAAYKTVQAIARMTVLAAHASKIGAVYTCNGNKSESAFGFVTRDGDGRGSIAPLGDLLKGEVYQIAHYLNTVLYGREVIPLSTITVDPMDELGPREAGVVRKDPFDYGRVDQDGTLSRGYHDAWVHAVVGYRKNPEWFLELYQAKKLDVGLGLPAGKVDSLFPTAEAFITDLERCWKMFFAATQKRVQSGPNILVSKRAFGYDYRESVLGEYYTHRYQLLKQSIKDRCVN